MAKTPDLAGARILVTNDDGIHAPGLKVLQQIAKSLSKDVWVVAPESEQSAVAHALTLRRPVRLRQLGKQRYALDGTPTDCVLIAVKKLFKERPPDLVLSGVNDGGNLGEDVTYSGTVAAAMEGALLGLRSIALSQQRVPRGGPRFAVAERHAPGLVRKLAGFEWGRDLLINVNFPACAPDEVKGVVACRQGSRDLGSDIAEGEDPGGRPYLWIGSYRSDKTRHRNTDLAAVAGDAIAVTPLHLDLTHRAALKRLQTLLG